jgi:predicted RNA-binding Zn ribbon-like protein
MLRFSMDHSGQHPSGEPGERAVAPGTLAVVQDFANAHFTEDPQERERDAEPLAAWLVRHGLGPRGARLIPHERERLLALRGAIRTLLEANDGAPVDRVAIQRLNEIAAASTLRIEFTAEGEARLATSERGTAGATAHLLAYMMQAMSDGTWPRLKLCRADDCRWAYYDLSKNRSGAWCSMAGCGNRAKARAYRERHRR